MSKALFVEKQKFRQKWVIIIIAITTAVALWGFIQQLILDKPFGNNPASDSALILLLLFPILISIFFIFLTLHTRIDRNGVTYRFAPIHRKERLIKWSSIKVAYVRKYKPIAEYGGWGFRKGRSGRAYNTSGNMGLQLQLSDGKRVLLGTQNPKDLKSALDKLGKGNLDN